MNYEQRPENSLALISRLTGDNAELTMRIDPSVPGTDRTGWYVTIYNDEGFAKKVRWVGTSLKEDTHE
jgi:hypothetical protein